MVFAPRDPGTSAAAGSADAQEADERLRGDDGGSGATTTRREEFGGVGSVSDDGGAEESPPGAGDETGMDDPDAGDDTTRRLKPGAESDPMTEQTERDGGSGSGLSPAEQRRLVREAGRDDGGRSSETVENITDPGRRAGEYGASPEDRESAENVADITDPERRAGDFGESGGRTPSRDDVRDRPSPGADDPSPGGAGGGGGPGVGGGLSPDDVREQPEPDRPAPTSYEDLSRAEQRRLRRRVQNVSDVERGILDPRDFALTPEDEEGDRRVVLGESGRRSLVARNVRREGDVDRFDPERDIEQVGQDAFVVTVGVDGDTETRRIAFSEEGAETLRERQRSELVGTFIEDFEEQTGEDIDRGDVAVSEDDGQLRIGLTLEATQERQGPAETTRYEEFGSIGPAPERTTREEEFGDIGSAGLPGDIAEEIDRQLERDVGAERVRRTSTIDPSAVPPSQLEGLADLERGEDYRITGSREEGYTAVLTEEFSTELTREFAESDIERRTGVDLDRSEIEVTGDGVRLTESGQAKVREEVTGDEYDYPVRHIPVPWVAADAIGSGEGQTVSDIPGFVDVPISSLPGVSEEDARLEDVLTGTRREISEAAESTSEDVTGFIFDRYDDETSPQWALDWEAQTERALAAGLKLPAYAVDAVSGTKELAEFAPVAIDRARTEGVGPGVDVTLEDPGSVRLVETGADRPGPTPPVLRTSAPEFNVQVAESGAAGLLIDEGIETGGQIVGETVELVSTPGGRAEAAGGLVFSAILMGGAGAVSSRAGMASRLAIQPGEEILGYGGHAVTRRVAGRGAADRFFPNQEPILFSEEFAIRQARRAGRAVGSGARRAGGATRTGAARLRSGVDTTVTPRLAEARRRAPSLSFEIDPDAGILEIDPAVRQQLREYAVERPAGRARSAAETARRLPGTAVEVGREAPRLAAETAVSGAETAAEGARTGVRLSRQGFTRAELAADEFGFRAGFETGRQIDRLMNLDPDLLGRFEAGAGRVRGGVESAREGLAQRYTRAELAADEFGYQSGLRVGRGIRTAEELPGRVAEFPGVVAEAGATRARTGVRLGRQGFTRAELAADEFGFQSGIRVGRGIRVAEELPGRVADLPGAAAEGARTGVRLGRQGFTRAELAADEFGYQTGLRTGDAIATLEDFEFSGELRESLIEAPGRARAAPREAAAGFAVGSRRAGVADLPRFEAFPGQLTEGRAFDVGLGLGETELGARTQIAEGASALRSEVTERREQLSSLRDLTVRVEPGIPRLPRVSTDIMDVGDVDALRSGLGDMGLDMERPGRGEAEATDDLIDEPGWFDAPSRGDTGVAVQRVRARTETEVESESPLGSDLMETTGPRLEMPDVVGEGSGIGGDLIQGLGSDLRADTTPLEAPAEMGRLGDDMVTDLRADLGYDAEVVGEPVGDIVGETEIVGERVGLDLREEFDLELEFEIEQEVEKEVEVEVDTDRRRRRRDPLDDRGRDGFGFTIHRELLNPVTGR